MFGGSRSSVLVLLVGSVLAGVPATLAQPVPIGPEFQVNTYHWAFHHQPAVATDGAGNFVVVWSSSGSAGTDTEQGSFRGSIQGQRYDSTGVPQGNQFQVNTYTTDVQQLPAVAADAAGNFVVVWSSLGNEDMDDLGGGSGGSGSIQGQRYDSAGVPQGNQFQVNTYTTNLQSLPAVAADAAGNFVVVWQSFGSAGTDTDDRSIHGQRYDSNGVAQGGEFQVNTYTTNWQLHPAVAADAAGNFVVAWSGRGHNGERETYSVQAQRYDSNGMAQGGEFQVNTYTTLVARFPAVAADPVGNFVVAWLSEGFAGYDTIQAQRYDSNGMAQGSEFQVNTYTTGPQLNPAIAADAAGNFVVVWQSYVSDGPFIPLMRIQGRRYDSTGIAQGDEFQVNTHTPNYPYSPAVAADAAGNFVVVWDTSQYFPNTVRAQLFSVTTTCPPAPDPSCIDLNTPGTRLILREDVPGSESLSLRTGRGPAQVATALGDPTVGGGTRYALCLYRDGSRFVREYDVDRPADTCGGSPCWRGLGPPLGGSSTNGYRYVDSARTEDGIRVLELRTAQSTQVTVRGRNGTGSNNLPLGVPLALGGATSATVQVHGSDATQCLSVTLPQVRRSTATVFVAVE